ncbi:hypothetical protein MBLNU459_g8193t1 [Dothideomycetes sp. NU459]
MSADSPPLPLLRPRPRQPFELTPLSSTSSTPTSTDPEPPMLSDADNANPPSRTRSILNLTSSTLFGIYSPAGYAPDRDEATTPWGTGAETPVDGRPADFSRFEAADGDEDALLMRSKARRGSMLAQSTTRARSKPSRAVARKPKGFRATVVPLLRRTIVLGSVGTAYGLLISQLHGRQRLAPVQVDAIPHGSWQYLAFWCAVAVVLGQLMPFVDRLWDADGGTDDAGEEYRSSGGQKSAQDRDSRLAARSRNRGWAPVWYDLVRTVGASVGIAFAIRRLPWQSTLQLSLTLALANPAIWYLLDRTPPGFILSCTVALSGTGLLLSINPDLVPPPSPSVAALASAATNGTLARDQLEDAGALVAGLFSLESVGVATWIASVLFVSCVFFGNIGRRL